MPPTPPKSSPLKTRERLSEVRYEIRGELARRARELEALGARALGIEEARVHPHMQARGAYVEHDGIWHTAPAPRFSRTPGAVRSSAASARLCPLLESRPVSLSFDPSPASTFSLKMMLGDRRLPE